MPARILLLSFRFPPFDRVGAYRWSKLSGRLARLGHKLDIVTVKWPRLVEQDWHADVSHPGINIHRLPSFYPHRIKYRKLPHQTLSKARGALFAQLNKIFPGHEEAALWGASAVPYCVTLLRMKRSDIIIATGAPYVTNYWASQVKRLSPHIPLIQDFRDPWISDSGSITKRFRDAVEPADLLVAVTPEMTALYQQLAGGKNATTIPNGVELARLRSGAALPVKNDFAYIGALANDRVEPLRRFLDWSRQRARDGKAVTTVLVGRLPPGVEREHQDLVERGLLQLRSPVAQAEAFDVVRASRFALHFNGPNALSATQVTTKIPEYAALNTPTLSLNYGGAASAFIKERDLGWSFDVNDSELFANLERALESKREFSFNVDDLDFDAVGQRYSGVIESLLCGKPSSV